MASDRISDATGDVENFVAFTERRTPIRREEDRFLGTRRFGDRRSQPAPFADVSAGVEPTGAAPGTETSFRRRSQLSFPTRKTCNTSSGAKTFFANDQFPFPAVPTCHTRTSAAR